MRRWRLRTLESRDGVEGGMARERGRCRPARGADRDLGRTMPWIEGPEQGRALGTCLGLGLPLMGQACQ